MKVPEFFEGLFESDLHSLHCCARILERVDRVADERLDLAVDGEHVQVGNVSDAKIIDRTLGRREETIGLVG